MADKRFGDWRILPYFAYFAYLAYLAYLAAE